MAEYHRPETNKILTYPERVNKRFWSGGEKESNKLIHPMKQSIAHAKQIDLVVSFLMESGVRLLLEDLRDAMNRQVPIRILCGAYMSITEPSALVLLKNELGPHAELRMDVNLRRSFHPKCYIFHNENGCHAYIGSSNLSASALTSGVEWNYRVDSQTDSMNLNQICEEFEELFEQSRILDEELLNTYCQSWKKPPIVRQIEFDDRLNDQELVNHSLDTVKPHGVQIEALYALKKTRENGNKKAMIQAATGVGKTYLAAFDSLEFQKVLFVAHRKEILEQAARSFYHVRPDQSLGFIDGDHKDMDQDLTFASVATLCSDNILQEDALAPDTFDYIIIDEFHHAAAHSYSKILNYFKPKFLLGLTATPQRMDGRSVYALCDFNVPYSINLQSAINRGLLVPFRYYAIYDKVDYSIMRKSNGRLNIQDLEEAYSLNIERNQNILKHYRKYPSKQAIGFCASKNHALQMSRFFNENGILAAAVYSGSKDDQYTMTRQKAHR